MATQRDSTVSALEEVTQAAFTGVLLALERRRIKVEDFPGPILIGIIAWPELRNLPNLPQGVKTAGKVPG
jgi:hypothetical protein